MMLCRVQAWAAAPSLTVQACAEVLGLSRARVLRLIERGDIETVCDKGARRVAAGALVAFCRKRVKSCQCRKVSLSENRSAKVGH